MVMMTLEHKTQLIRYYFISSFKKELHLAINKVK